ncbi:aldo/keto reductase [Gilvimarinus sp. F26214L]|uniref:aldo/keto reductase n=1 Tax=Gilvimarinus sp. DZF01 TaxID=3461371 RepID=UPI0040457B3B
MVSRRTLLSLALKAAGATALAPYLSFAQESSSPLITRAIPSTGEQLPVIGLGSSATFSQVARSEDKSALKEVLAALVEQGGRVFDTAPSYGASEEVAGEMAEELDITNDIFWATKLNVAPRGGGKADPDEARAQLDRSFARIKKPVIDLIQVHNLGDPDVQLGLLKDLKEQEKLRYIGVTTTFPRQYEQLISIMKNEPLDFIGIDYAIDNREVEETILPLAQEQKIGVLVYAPFGRTRLWQRVNGREVPEWAGEFGARSWAQFFLKFILAHPAVTAITPATSKERHMVDNMGAARGALPDAEARERMIELVESLPEV